MRHLTRTSAHQPADASAELGRSRCTNSTNGEHHVRWSGHRQHGEDKQAARVGCAGAARLRHGWSAAVLRTSGGVAWLGGRGRRRRQRVGAWSAMGEQCGHDNNSGPAPVE